MTAPTSTSLASIVVGFDDSPESLHALDLAAMIGTPQSAALAIVHVRPKPKAFGLGPAGSVEYAQALDEIDTRVAVKAADRLAGYPSTVHHSRRSVLVAVASKAMTNAESVGI